MLKAILEECRPTPIQKQMHQKLENHRGLLRIALQEASNYAFDTSIDPNKLFEFLGKAQLWEQFREVIGAETARSVENKVEAKAAANSLISQRLWMAIPSGDGYYCSEASAGPRSFGYNTLNTPDFYREDVLSEAFKTKVALLKLYDENKLLRDVGVRVTVNDNTTYLVAAAPQR
jgi:hypothetical protein